HGGRRWLLLRRREIDDRLCDAVVRRNHNIGRRFDRERRAFLDLSHRIYGRSPGWGRNDTLKRGRDFLLCESAHCLGVSRLWLGKPALATLRATYGAAVSDCAIGNLKLRLAMRTNKQHSGPPAGRDFVPILPKDR